jgi:hypothetical protein
MADFLMAGGRPYSVAIPKLLEMMTIEGAIETVDAPAHVSIDMTMAQAA